MLNSREAKLEDKLRNSWNILKTRGEKETDQLYLNINPTLSNLKPEEMNYYRNNDASKVFNV